MGRSWRKDRLPTPVFLGFPHGSDGQESTWNAGDLGSIPGLGRSPGEVNSYPFQCSGLENSLDREAWEAKSPCRLHSILVWPFVSKTALTEDCKHLVPQDCFCHCSASVAATRSRKRKCLLYPFSSTLPCMTLILAEYKMGVLVAREPENSGFQASSSCDVGKTLKDWDSMENQYKVFDTSWLCKLE